MASNLYRVDLNAARETYEKASDNDTPFAQLVDECFDGVKAAIKARTQFLFKGDDRAEVLVAAIANYLIECERQ